MRGQWIGPFQGTNKGIAVIELDDLGDHYEGVAFAYSERPDLPSLFAGVRTPGKENKFDLKLSIDPIDIRRGLIVSWDSIKNNYPGITLAPSLQTSWERQDDDLTLTWQSPVGTNGNAKLARSKAGTPSQRGAFDKVKSWAEFKEFAVTLEPNRFVFRGQEDSIWRLRTYFHRAGRFNLMKFVGQDIGQLHGNLSSITQHHFNLKDELENAAFHSLVQHHGYPTPLLDWTASPFIAAYFAFRKVRDRQEGKFVRIFVLDQREWQRDMPTVGMISPAPLHFSFLSPLAINNIRMVPQQALSTVTNVDDIEHFIAFQEELHKKNYLHVIDLPAADRPQIIHELALMGITAGSMFPGLDGACEQLKEKNFNL